jgi:hypothetical protein
MRRKFIRRQLIATQTHESKTTTNHGEIKRWVEERGGRPAYGGASQFFKMVHR